MCFIPQVKLIFMPGISDAYWLLCSDFDSSLFTLPSLLNVFYLTAHHFTNSWTYFFMNELPGIASFWKVDLHQIQNTGHWVGWILQYMLGSVCFFLLSMISTFSTEGFAANLNWFTSISACTKGCWEGDAAAEQFSYIIYSEGELTHFGKEIIVSCIISFGNHMVKHVSVLENCLVFYFPFCCSLNSLYFEGGLNN